MELSVSERNALFNEVAAQLGPEWSCQIADWRGRLLGPNNYALDITIAWSKKTHVHIDGTYPGWREGKNYLPYNAKRPEIYVAIDRGAAAIAKEITRRLLPEYVPLGDNYVHRLYKSNRRGRT